MNKKGEISDIFLNVLIIFFIILLTYSGINLYYSIVRGDRIDRACQEIGFEEYKSEGNFNFCIENGNYHYVDMDCPFHTWNKCTATEISIGDVRVK